MTYEVLPGGAALQDHLEAMVERASDMEPAFTEIVEVFRRIEAQRFDDNGPGWPPLADSTISMTGSWARQNTNYDEILVDTGALLESLEGGPGSYVLMTPFEVETGTLIPYAHWHQTGGFRLHESGAGWPPQRKIVDLDEKDLLEFAEVIAGWIFHGEPKAA